VIHALIKKIKYALVRPVECRLSCDAGWLRWMSWCQTALAKGLRKFGNALFLFEVLLVLLGEVCVG